MARRKMRLEENVAVDVVEDIEREEREREQAENLYLTRYAEQLLARAFLDEARREGITPERVKLMAMKDAYGTSNIIGRARKLIQDYYYKRIKARGGMINIEDAKPSRVAKVFEERYNYSLRQIRQ